MFSRDIPGSMLYFARNVRLLTFYWRTQPSMTSWHTCKVRKYIAASCTTTYSWLFLLTLKDFTNNWLYIIHIFSPLLLNQPISINKNTVRVKCWDRLFLYTSSEILELSPNYTFVSSIISFSFSGDGRRGGTGGSSPSKCLCLSSSFSISRISASSFGRHWK